MKREGTSWVDLAVYRSEALLTPSHIGNLDILREALDRNRALGVTGFLLRRNGFFLQALEGPADHIDRLLHGISRDPRHSEMVLLGRERGEQRRFGEWSMGYSDAGFPGEPRVSTLRLPAALALLTDVACRNRQKTAMYQSAG